MQTITAIVALLCLRVAGVALASTSHDNKGNGLESLPTDLLPDIKSRLPIRDLYRLSLASSYLRKEGNNIIDIVSDLFVARFDKERCLIAALRIENAPPGLILHVVKKLLRSNELANHCIRTALKKAYAVGHCDIVDLLAGHLQNSPSNTNFSVDFDGASCKNITRLSFLPLKELLGMHALPRTTFLQIIAAKYGSDYESFFHDPAWYSLCCSHTVMSHALHLYQELNGAFDFEPVPFGYIASKQTISEVTLRILEDPSCNHFIFSHLQLVLKPESSLRFPQSLNNSFKKRFLMEACKAERLAWVKSLVEHELWRDVKLESWELCQVECTGNYHYPVVRFADVIEDVDPAVLIFQLVFYHQITQHSSISEQLRLCASLSNSLSSRPARQIVRFYTSPM